jgi:hypothetical protein
MTTDIQTAAAAVLFNCYWYVHIAELIVGGASPRDASEACWRGYYQMLAASELREREGGIGPTWAVYDPHVLEPDTGPHPHWTNRCLRAALAANESALAMSWDDYVRQVAFFGAPRSWITTTALDSLRWQISMMWLLATGAGDVFHCARVAHDRASGKPVRRRKPADATWLASELDWTLTGVWDALRLTDDGAGCLLWTRPPSQVRPRANRPRWW